MHPADFSPTPLRLLALEGLFAICKLRPAVPIPHWAVQGHLFSVSAHGRRTVHRLRSTACPRRHPMRARLALPASGRRNTVHGCRRSGFSDRAAGLRRDFTVRNLHLRYGLLADEGVRLRASGHGLTECWPRDRLRRELGGDSIDRPSVGIDRREIIGPVAVDRRRVQRARNR